MADWPIALRTLVDVVVGARQPMRLTWGDSLILIYNEAYVPLLGGKHPAALGRPLFDVWPESRDTVGPLMTRVMAGESVHRERMRFVVERDGGREPIVVSFSYIPVFDGDRVAGTLCAAVELTAEVDNEIRLVDESRRQREVQRRQSALLTMDSRFADIDDPVEMEYVAARILATTLAVSRAGYGTIDPVAETIVIERDWNAPGIASIAGVLRFRDYGTYIEDIKAGRTVVVADADVDPRTRHTAVALKAISAAAFINMPIVEHGETVAFVYLNNASPRQWPADEVDFVRDVARRTRVATERVRAQRSLRELNASLERLVAERTAERDRVWKNSRDLLVVIGSDGVFRAINPAFKTILGYEPSELIGHPFSDFLWPDDVPNTQSALDEAAAAHDLTNFENRYRHKDGTPRWISWHTSVEGDLVYANGRHVTEEKAQAEALANTEERLRQAQKMEAVGQLTGGIAHDFNNLLMGISGSLEFLSTRLAQGRMQDLERYIATAQGAARRAAALTHRLLAFSRRQTLDPKAINTNRLVEGMEDLLRRSVGPGVTIEFVGAVGLWTTYVDTNQLESALLNLCINARDAMPDGGKITIETANRWLDDRAARERDLAPGQFVSLCVSDTGTGMSPDTVRRAFDPFFTTKPLGMGTGLGLSMVYGFARQSGGQVRIYSEPGQGAMVCLYLPRHHGDAVPDPVLAQPPIVADGDGETVLVIDDEASVRALVMEVLGELGYHAIEAGDAPSGMKLIESDVRIDLLITDVGLPGGMNGRQVADAALVVRPQLKVLFITGYAENAAVGNGQLGPAMEVLTKPFAIQDLADRIRRLIGTQSGDQASARPPARA